VKIVVLGAGRVGRAIARDLAGSERGRVTAVDVSAEALAPLEREGIRVEQADLADRSKVAALAAEHDLVVGAGPARLGFATLETVIDTGRSVVDISFFEEDPFRLDALARSRRVVAAVDAGVSPGLSSMLCGYEQATSGRVLRFVCYVGGLPTSPTGPMRYRAPFAPSDVIELYTRPARHVRDGRVRTDPALSLRTELTVPEIGPLEAFLTDGLRTMLREDGVPEMREMTLRYPGHVAQIALLRELGFFAREPIDVAGQSVSPRVVTERLLFPHWEFRPDEEDLTVLRVEIDVETAGRRLRRAWHLLDRYDASTGTSSMARTTGYTCTAVVDLVASGAYARSGIAAPEDIGRAPGCFERVVRHLADRGIALGLSEAAVG
jgi:saccharopine dehydrogenase-like NADP-dependent oxidoreductase